MSLGLAFVTILIVALAAGWLGFGRARRLRTAGRLHSLPVYHGAYALLWAAIPALLILAAWAPIQSRLVDQAVLSSPEGKALPAFDMQRESIMSEAREIAHGERAQGFNPESSQLAPRISEAESRYALIGGAVAILAALAAAGLALRRSAPQFRARAGVERWLMIVLFAASLIAILTTLGILLSLMFESLRFFRLYPVHSFLFGLEWSPQTAIRADQAGSSGAFGSIPLMWGTFFIGAIIAMVVAVPLGLMSAIYLTQYAHPRVRAWLKPILEILAGVPTVVYGYFAALTVAPVVRDFGLSIGISSASSESALAAGAVMGIMIIPFISSMADDSIAAVPQSMRDGSLALGATQWKYDGYYQVGVTDAEESLYSANIARLNLAQDAVESAAHGVATVARKGAEAVRTRPLAAAGIAATVGLVMARGWIGDILGKRHETRDPATGLKRKGKKGSS